MIKEDILQIWIPIRTAQEGSSFWSAYCDVLGLASCGNTETEAESKLDKAVELYCDILTSKGLLIERLKEKGIKYEIINVPESKSHGKANLRPVLVGDR